MLAYCGLNCDSCPIYLASLEPDKLKQQAMRESIAEFCAKEYGISMQADSITDCDGCNSSSERLFSGCRNCTIRTCAMSKGIENCAYCNDYGGCPSLIEIFQYDAEAKERLDKIRNHI